MGRDRAGGRGAGSGGKVTSVKVCRVGKGGSQGIVGFSSRWLYDRMVYLLELLLAFFLLSVKRNGSLSFSFSFSHLYNKGIESGRL